MHTRSLLPSRMLVAVAVVTSAWSCQPALAQNAAPLVGLQVGTNLAGLLGLQLNVDIIGGVASGSPAPAPLSDRIQAATGKPLSAAAQRYLADRRAPMVMGASSQCGESDLTFNLIQRSYGPEAARGRRQLNECTPALLPISGAL